MTDYTAQLKLLSHETVVPEGTVCDYCGEVLKLFGGAFVDDSGKLICQLCFSDMLREAKA